MVTFRDFNTGLPINSEFFPSVTQEEAITGLTDYLLVEMQNFTADEMGKTLTASIFSSTPSPDSECSIALSEFALTFDNASLTYQRNPVSLVIPQFIARRFLYIRRVISPNAGSFRNDGVTIRVDIS